MQKGKLALYLVALLSVWACSSPPNETTTDLRTEQIVLIDSLKVALKAQFEKSPSSPDLPVLNNLAGAYVQFARQYPKDSLVPVYLFDAAQLYAGFLRKPRLAATLFEEVYDQHQQYKQRPMALFMSANAYHDVGDTTSAVKGFELFLKNHPGHPFAKDARHMLRFIRMSPEELEAFFNKKDSLPQLSQ